MQSDKIKRQKPIIEVKNNFYWHGRGHRKIQNATTFYSKWLKIYVYILGIPITCIGHLRAYAYIGRQLLLHMPFDEMHRHFVLHFNFQFVCLRVNFRTRSVCLRLLFHFIRNRDYF